jgi:hypothetical protein
MFAEIVEDQRVVLRVAEKRCDPLERFEKAGEIFVRVFLFDFGFGEDDAVTACQRANGRGLDRSFEMKVQFRKADRVAKSCAIGGCFFLRGRVPLSFRIAISLRDRRCVFREVPSR